MPRSIAKISTLTSLSYCKKINVTLIVAKECGAQESPKELKVVHIIDPSFLEKKPFTWKKLDKELKKVHKSSHLPKRGPVPKTHSRLYMESVKSLVNFIKKFQPEDSTEKAFQVHLAILLFLKEHPLINQYLFQHVSNVVELELDLTNHMAPSPVAIATRKKDEKQDGEDYALTGVLWLDDERNYTHDPSETYTEDPEESKWDYWREDPLLNVFHRMVHSVRYVGSWPKLKTNLTFPKLPYLVFGVFRAVTNGFPIQKIHPHFIR